MSIRFNCSCGKRYDVPEAHAGRRVRCSGCKAVMEVPGPTPARELAHMPVSRAIAPGVDPDFIDLSAQAAPPPGPAPARYEYKMVQIPPTISVAEGTPYGQRAASYLEGVVIKVAADGWEFHRIDPIGIHEAPGCFGALLGAREKTTQFYVISFRRPASP